MLSTKNLIKRTLSLVVGFYILICILLYFFQERLIFFPAKLERNFNFSFAQPFREVNISRKNGKLLHGLLFTTTHPKGLIFYLHGNAGSLDSWGEVAETYIRLGYDVFLLDYAGYGKSEGSIRSEKQFLDDVQAAYDSVKKLYEENRIVIIGYSIGTGPAAYLASVNHPRLLILQAPYYSLKDLMRHHYPLIPTFLLKYPLPVHEYLEACNMPVILFHGNRDEVIYYESSLKLQKNFKSGDSLITLNGQGHNGITENPQYIEALNRILDEFWLHPRP